MLNLTILVDAAIHPGIPLRPNSWLGAHALADWLLHSFTMVSYNRSRVDGLAREWAGSV